jgi:uncharacterized protein involved in exopolysaccharide biosynthesis
MKNTIKRLISLYPRPWRNRYENEFKALLDDVPPSWGTFFNVFGGAMKMQFKTGKSWKIVAASALAGVIAGMALTWTIPHRYVSTAVISVADIGDAQLNAEALKILARAPLTRLIVEADLYRDLRATTPIEDVVLQLKTEDIMIKAAGGKQMAVSVTAPDAGRAQKATQILAANFLEANVGTLVDPASLPVTPNGPRLSRNIVMGLIAGLLLGALVALFAGLRVWKLAAGLGLAGAIAGAAVAYVLPERYSSTAVIRLEVQKHAVAEDRIRQLFQAATSDDACRALINRFNLYPGESEPERRLREHLHVETVGNGVAMMIRFDYVDRFKAQKVVGDVVSRLIDGAVMHHGGPSTSMTLELIDPASLSLRPYFPNRPVVTGTGLLAGLALAVVVGIWERYKRSLPAVAAR